mmetsp:Transcript_36351/g.78857  ORF Transcript_36351/g.78857 Transcript_36351/m.78857 type:complete len:219 (-) Transcript_36351:430-1086(-)
MSSFFIFQMSGSFSFIRSLGVRIESGLVLDSLFDSLLQEAAGVSSTAADTSENSIPTAPAMAVKIASMVSDFLSISRSLAMMVPLSSFFSYCRRTLCCIVNASTSSRDFFSVSRIAAWSRCCCCVPAHLAGCWGVVMSSEAACELLKVLSIASLRAGSAGPFPAKWPHSALLSLVSAAAPSASCLSPASSHLEASIFAGAWMELLGLRFFKTVNFWAV